MKKKSYITVTDQFCGAGGSSQGVRKYAETIGGGVEVKLALNHWKLAIDTHNTNFPDTIHDCTDISACDPRRYISTDILITSPECTNHSLAKGKRRKWMNQLQLFGKIEIDPSEERSRATMWDVPRFAEVHDYNIIITENVVDARNWVMWEPWLMAMHKLGYKHKAVYLNSMHFPPTPQSRDRMYVVFWKAKNKTPDLDYRPAAYCPACDKEVNSVQVFKNPMKQFGKYRTQYFYRCPVCTAIVEPYYYAAFNVIDWSIKAKRIGDRKKPLAPPTMKRIEYGHEKYGDMQFLIHLDHSKVKNRAQPITGPISTQTTRQVAAIVEPPMIIEMNRTGKSRESTEPLATVTAGGNKHGLLQAPMIIEHFGNSNAKPIEKPLGAIMTKEKYGILQSPVFMVKNYGGNKKSIPVNESLHTVTAQDHHGLIQAPVIVENKGQSKAKSADKPLSTQTSMINHGILSSESVNAFLSYYYGTAQASGIHEATGTVTTTDRISLVLKSEKVKSIEDYTYRMLKAHEIIKAMAFDDDYIVLGNSRDKVRQAGNAVTPPVMQWIIERCIESLK